MAHILIADDDRDLTQMIATILQGHACTIANSGYQAIELYAKSRQQGQHHFDLIILDLAMLDMTGFQVEEAIRATGDSISKVVFLSGHFGSVTQREAFKASLDRAAGVWDKPIEAGSFQFMVQGVLNGCQKT